MSADTVPLAWPSTLASSRRILVDLWLRHRNQRTLWLGGVLAAVCFALTLAPLAFVPAGPGERGRLFLMPVLAAFACATLLGVCWLMTVASVMEQNHPVLARTVPGHARRLRAALLLPAGALLVFTAAATAAVTAAGGASSRECVVATMAAACIAASVLAYVGLAVRWPGLWIATWIGPAITLSFLPDLQRLLAPLSWVARSPAAMAALAVAVLAAAAAIVRSLVEQGGERHERRHAALCKRSSRSARGLDKGLELFLPDGQQRRLAGLRDRMYAHAARRLLARGRASPVTRAMLAFGPALHWTAQLGAIGGVGALVLLLGVAMALAPTNVPLGGVMTGFLASLVFACSRLALNAHGALHATRGEQALLALAPGVPRGGALNRAIGWRLAAQFLGCWAFGLAVAQLVQALLRSTVAFGSAGALGSWSDITLLLALSQLLLVPMLWRRWYRTPPATPSSVFVPVLVPGVVALGAIAVVHAGVLSMAAAGALVATAAAAWSGRRWVRIGAEPSMLPVGRLHR